MTKVLLKTSEKKWKNKNTNNNEEFERFYK